SDSDRSEWAVYIPRIVDARLDVQRLRLGAAAEPAASLRRHCGSGHDLRQCHERERSVHAVSAASATSSLERRMNVPKHGPADTQRGVVLRTCSAVRETIPVALLGGLTVDR